MPDRPATPDLTAPFRLAALPARQATHFDIRADAALRARVARALGLRDLRKLRLAGEIRPERGEDWRLEAELGATAVQDCVVTLEPVTTRVDAPVSRLWTPRAAEPAPGTETEMPEDDSVEPLPARVDLVEVMTEALALALPDFPRAEGAEMPAAEAAPPGAAPIGEEEVRPFAGLAALRDRMNGGD